MSIRDTYDYLASIINEYEFRLVPIDLTNDKFWIWGAKEVRLLEPPESLKGLRDDNSRVNVFVNGQFIDTSSYKLGYQGNFLLIKFIKFRFEYKLDETDQIIIRGDLQPYDY